MLWVYLSALILGAGMLALQAIMGHDADGDVDADHDADHDASLLFSSRFWIFLALAFGLAGTLLTLFHLASVAVVLGLSTFSGLASGLFAAWVLRALKQGQVSSSASVDEAVGRVAEVLVPCEKGKVGKVRLSLRGQTVDLLAMGGEHPLNVGTKVVVEEIEGGIARVTRAPDEITG
ncbi:MAG: NfeD family protein [Deltaproteobacteria bacterium]|nr:NfeD family protein [Deltaproteobacteria bacterium]